MLLTTTWINSTAWGVCASQVASIKFFIQLIIYRTYWQWCRVRWLITWLHAMQLAIILTDHMIASTQHEHQPISSWTFVKSFDTLCLMAQGVILYKSLESLAEAPRDGHTWTILNSWIYCSLTFSSFRSNIKTQHFQVLISRFAFSFSQWSAKSLSNYDWVAVSFPRLEMLSLYHLTGSFTGAPRNFCVKLKGATFQFKSEKPCEGCWTNEWGLLLLLFPGMIATSSYYIAWHP